MQCLAERAAQYQLGGEVVDVARLAEVVDGDDVGMIERGGRARLLLEAPHAGFVARIQGWAAV